MLERRIGKMFMLDYSLNNLRMASARLSNTTLVRSELGRLPFDDDVFDFVAMIRVIHHLPDPDPLLAEVVRVSRNGGTFVLGMANQLGRGVERPSPLIRVTAEGHRIYSTPLGRFAHPGLERVDVLGVGAFDNRLGRKAERLTPLATLDLETSRLWPVKPMLFARYRVRKREGKNEPRVLCGCGGRIVGRRCERCGRAYGQIIDLVEDSSDVRGPANP